MNRYVLQESGRVIEIHGQVFIENEDGTLQNMAVGDSVNSGITLILNDGAEFKYQLLNGEIIEHVAGSTDDTIEQNDEQSFTEQDDEIAQIQQALEQGDFSQLEATAAGTDANSGTQAPAQIDSDGNETIAEAGFNTQALAAANGTLAETPDLFIVPENDSLDDPAVEDDSVAAAAGSPIVIDVLANDTELSPSPVIAVTQGQNGTVAINDDGTVTYTPNDGFSGNDSFTYTNAQGNTATVNIIVRDPAAEDDTVSVEAGSPITIDVLANDTDGTPSPVTSVTQGQNGTVTLNPDGTVTYTPVGNFSGNDSFTYTNALGNTATVNVTVNPPAAPAEDDSVSLDAGNPVVIDVIANDSEEDPSPIVSVTQGENGTVTINDDGTVTYTPNDEFTGDDSFTYTNADGNTATVNVTVNSEADSVVVDDNAVTEAGVPVVIDVLANDTDIDSEKSPVTSVTNGENGTVLINPDGTLTYTPSADFNGIDSFTYTNGEGNSATVTVTVSPKINETIINNDSVITDEDTAITIDVLANDTDIDSAPSPVTSATNGTNGTVEINGDGTLTYTPDPNFNGPDSFTYTNAEGNSATVNVTVTSVNDVTTVFNDTVVTGEDTDITIDVLANDNDIDEGPSPVIAVSNGQNGTVAINPDGTVTYSPNANFNGPDSFTYTNAEGNTATVNVIVNSVDDATIIASDRATTDESTAVVIDVLANDAGIDSQAATVTAVTNGNNGSVEINADGTLTYTPNANFTGTDTFTYTNAEGSTALVNVVVNPVTDQTTVANDRVAIDEDRAVTIDVLANDTTVGSESSPIVSVTNGANGNVILNDDGTVTYTPDVDFNGTDSFTYTNTEGNTATVNVTVDPIDDQTQITNDIVVTDEDTEVTIDVLANDTDVDSDVSPLQSFTQGGNGSVVLNENGTLTYTPHPNFNGEDSFTYTNFEGNVATVNVTVNGINDVTIVENDSVSTDEDSPVIIDVIANDTDSDSSASSVQSVTQGANGSVSINNNGTLTYTPNANFNGADSFTYTNQEGNTATVNVTVNPVSDDTVVVNDSVTTDEDNAVTIDVLANDTDVDSAPSPVQSVTQGQNGRVAINENGTVAYTPNANFHGSDSFSYMNAEGNTATVNVTVNPVSDDTIVVNDDATTEEDNAVTIDVLANDTDVDSAPSPVQSVTQGQNGTVTINENGTVTYTPNANYSGADSFTYTNAEGNTATVNVTVTPAEPTGPTNPTDPVDVGTVVVNDSATTEEDNAVTIDVVANDTDVDSDPSPVQSVTQGQNGTVAINENGTVTYTPNANYSGTDSFTYTNAEGNTAAVNVTVTPAEPTDPTNPTDPVDVETVVVNDSATTEEDNAVTIDVVANDTDVDSDPSQVQSVTQGQNGTVTINENGTVTYTPNANYSGTDSFTYTNAEGNIAAVNVTVTPAEPTDPTNPTDPVDVETVVVNDSATTEEDNAVTIDVLANDTDVDSAPSPVQSVTQGQNGTVTINENSTVTYTPNTNFHGSDSFTYTNAEGNTATVNVTVNAFEDDTVVVNDTVVTNEDNAVTIDVVANDTDVDSDPSPVQSVTQGTNGSVVVNENGTVTYTPNANYSGTDSFTYTNAEGNTAAVNVTVTPAEPTDPTNPTDPVDVETVVVNDSATTEEDNAVTIDVLANDTDVDSDPSPVESVTQGQNGTVTINENGTVTYTPNANYSGTDSFTYTNAEGNTAAVNVTVTPAEPTDPTNPTDPVDVETVVVNDSVETNEDNAVTIDVVANDTDVDSDPSPVQSVTQGTNGTVSINENGTVTYTPNANFHGSDSFTYTNAEGNTATVNVTVNAVEDDTVVVNDSVETNEDNAVTIDVLANDTDVDSDPSPVQSVTQGTNGTVSINENGTVTYTPNANFHGSDSFTYTNAEGNIATVNVTVNAVEDDTVVVNDSVETNEDNAVTIDVLANDTDIDSDPSPVQSVTQGQNGTVVLNENGTVTYTPNANFHGSDSFTYTNAEGNTATVNVTVNAVEDDTVVVNDSVETNEDNAVTIDVLANDTDVDSDPSPVQSVTQGTNGSVTINENGTVTYTPNANFHGSDSFTYTNTEGNTATVNVTVNAVEDDTVVVNDSVETNEDNAVTIDVVANDTDVDPDPSPVQSVTQGTNGSVTINENGTVTYTPNANFHGSDSFTYTNAEGNTATVNVTVNAVEDETIVVNDTVTTDEDNAVTIDVVANDTDVDSDPSPVQSVTQGTNGTVSINENGTVTYTPNANFHGLDSFTYTNAKGNTATVNVTVNAVEDDTVVVNDTVTTDEDNAVTIDVVANDTDVDSDSSPVQSVTQGTNGTVSINENGTVTYTPNANFYGSDSFTYTNAEGNTTTVNVTVNAVEDDTVVVNDTVETNEDNAVTIDVVANDTDVDSDPSPVQSVTQGQNGTVVLNENGTVTYTPNANFHGSDSFTYTNAEGNTATVNVSVNAVEDETIVVNDTVTTDEDNAVTIDVVANDTDVDSDPSPVQSVTQGTNGTVSINENGTVTYTPNANFHGSDSFTYTNAEGNTATVNVTVNAVEDDTVVVNDSVEINEDNAVTIDVVANDTDVDSDPSPVQSVTQGTNGTVSINENGTVTYTPNANFHGSDSFIYTNAEGNTATVNVTVNAVEDDTVVVNDTVETNEDNAVTIDVLANDTDVDSDPSPVQSVTQGTNGSVVINENGTVTYTPNANFHGSDSFTYTNAEGNTATVNVTVNAVEDETIVVNDTVTTDEDNAVTIDVLANDTDVDSDPSPVQSVTQGTNGSVVINENGTVTYTPNANFHGSDSFTYTNAEGNTATVNVTVNAVEDDTVVVNDSVETNEDNAVTIDVVANDTDVDSDPSPVQSVTQGTNGTVSINENGTVTYTPNANFHGSDSFTYTNAEGNTATVNVTVNAVEDDTVVVNDTVETNEDNAVTIDVVANDTDVDSDPSPVQSVTQGQNGTVVLNENGTVTYTPNANFHGSDSFTYTNAEGNTATVNVSVNAVEDETIVVNDTVTTDEDNAVTIDVVANDTDVDSDPSPVQSVTQGTNGSVVVNENGTVTYTPNANFHGSDSFTYTNAEGNTATVNVTVNAIEDDTVVVNDTVESNEDNAVTIDVVANDTDVDSDPSPVQSVTQGTNGTVSINENGTVTYTPNANFHGSDSFTYTNAEGNTATVNVTVNAIEDDTVVVNDTVESNEDNAVTIDVVANDTDIDSDPSPVQSVTQGTNGSVTINENGTVTYTPNANFHGSDSFTYTNAEGNTATVNVTVNAVEDDTVVVNDSVETNEDNAVTIDVLANDTDVDSAPSPVQSVTQGTNGTVSINENGTVTYTPNASFSGVDSFTYTNAEGNTATVNVTVISGAVDTPSTTISVTPVALPAGQMVTVGEMLGEEFGDGNIYGSDGFEYKEQTDVFNVDMGAGAANQEVTLILNANVLGSWNYGDYVQDDNWSVFVNGEQKALFMYGPGESVNVAEENGITTHQFGDPTNGYNQQDLDINHVFTTTIQLDENGQASIQFKAATTATDETVTINSFAVAESTQQAEYKVNISAALSEQNAQGELTVVVSGVPENATLTSGETNYTVTDLGNGQWQVEVPSGEDSITGALSLNMPLTESGDDMELQITTTVTNGSYTESQTETAILPAPTYTNVLLTGTDGNDVLTGTNNGDVLTGLAGDDILIGNEGADIFIFNAEDVSDNDIIADFNQNEGDAIDLSALLQGEENGSLTDYLSFDKDGQDTVISIDADKDGIVDSTIRLKDVDLGADTSSDAAIIDQLLTDSLLKIDINN